MPRVLLIDDEPRVSRALEYALTDSSLELHAVRDASDLDALARPSPPDVIRDQPTIDRLVQERERSKKP